MSKPASEAIEVKAPPKEIVTSQIAGIEVMDLEDAVKYCGSRTSMQRAEWAVQDRLSVCLMRIL